MDYALALLLIIADKPFQVDVDFKFAQELKRAAIALQITDESLTYFTHDHKYADDTMTMRELYKELKRTPKAEEVNALPSADEIGDMIAILLRAQQFYDNEINFLNGVDRNAVGAIIKELGKCYEAYVHMRNARDAEYVWQRRTNLNDLRKCIGYKAYYSRQWPTFHHLLPRY